VKPAKSQPQCEQCQARLKTVFSGLSDEDILRLNASKECSIYQKGQVIFRAGAFPHGLFCINSGKIKIYQSGHEGKEQIIHFAKEGEILGYRPLLSGEKYSSSAAAINDCTVCFIPKDVFTMLLEKNASLSRKLLTLLSHDLKEAENKITHIAQKPVRERIAEALLYLQEAYGYETDGATVNVVLTREEIANVAGTTPESAIRLLSEFRHEKMIRLRGKKIAFLNLPLLVKAANLLD
jgi:CRP/FNR family transcriptional regulator